MSRHLGALLFLLWAPLAAALPLHLTPVASGVYAVIADTAEPSVGNRGFVSNTALIVGPGGVVVVDPGPTLRQGVQLREQIRRQLRRPVAAVVLTHAHPENVLAASALAGGSVPVLAHARTYALMRDRCEECFARLAARIGDETMQGTLIRLPDQTLPDGITDRLIGGRSLRFIHAGWGHTAGDLAVLDVATGVLVAGGLVSNRVVPDTHEARIRGWIAALEALRAQPIRRVIPGQGAAGPASIIDEFGGYLRDLLARVEGPYREQLSVFDLLADGELPAYAAWARYRELHPLNIQHVYAELEREDFQAR